MKMANKKQEIKSLTWKYFWQQKREELYEFFYVTCKIYLIVGWMIGLFSTILLWESDISNGFIYTGRWWAVIPITLWLLEVAILALFLFFDWIDSNWKKADKRAKSEVKKRYAKGGLSE